MENQIRKGLEMGLGKTSSSSSPISTRGDAARARELLEHPVIKTGQAPSAREMLRMLVESSGAPSPMKLLTASLGGVGASWKTRAFLGQARAEIAAAKGKIDDAFAAVDDAVAGGLVDILWVDGCPLLREMRDDPRFPALRREVDSRAAAVRAAFEH